MSAAKTLPEVTEQDKERKKQHVVEIISKQCVGSAIPDLREIGEALANNGDQLDAEILSGGYTNYSYKLQLRSDRSKRLFAKLSFPHALWVADRTKHYNTNRTTNEFKMMQDFDRVAPGCVPKPYLCLDVGDECKLLVTEWSRADEQLANQMIDGTVDMRIPPKLGRMFAKLHLQDFNPTFNDEAARSECIHAAFDHFVDMFDVIANDESANNARAVSLTREIGSDSFGAWAKEIKRQYMEDRECLIHSDGHAFNILVEAKPDADLLSQSFGPNGNFAMCDFEMALAGPRGRELGVFNAFPLVCAIAHALNGHFDCSRNLVNAVEAVWRSYSEALREGGEKDASIYRTYKDIISWTGTFMLIANGDEKLHNTFMPPFESESDSAALVESARILGLTLLRLGMSNDVRDYEQLRIAFRTAVKKEIRLRSRPTNTAPRERRSSLLRASGRRVSDGPLGMVVVVDSASAVSSFPDLMNEE